MKKSSWGWVLALTILSAAYAFGQSANTSLRGTIKDPSGALVPGAIVTLTNGTNSQTLSATADSAGYYTFSQIPPARYTITVTANGFGNQSKTAELLVNQPATINFTLSVQASAETVDVSAEAQTINTTDATMGDSVGNKMVQALPMEGRNPIALLTLQPGVLFLQNDVTDTRSGSVSGGRSDQGNITLDGLDDNDELNGTAFTGVLRSTLDSTEEFRVTTSNGTADEGRSSGAQVTLVTKSGTNQFHGAVYEYNRPTNTVANDWFLKNSQFAQGLPNIPQKYILNTFGASTGGPIKKDKLFFFANYEGQRTAISQIEDAILPTADFYKGQVDYYNTAGQVKSLSSSDIASANYDGGCTPNPVPCGVNQNVINYYQPLANAGFVGISNTAGDGLNNAGYIFASPSPATLNTSIVKLDYAMTSKQHIFVRGNLQKDTTAGAENLPGQPPFNYYDDNTKGIAAGHSWTPTSNLVNDFRYGFIRQGYANRGVGSGTGDWVNFRFLTQPTSQQRSEVVEVPVHNFIDTLTWTKGMHTITGGFNWRMIWNDRSGDLDSYSGASTNPYWMYPGPNEPSDLSGGFENSYDIAFSTIVGTVPESTQQYNYKVTNPTTGTLIPDGANVSRHFKSNEFEYFIQDTWRVSPTVTVTYGIRHTLLQAPYETNGQQVSPTVDTHNWFLQRGAAAAQGQVYEPNLTFAPSGKANGKPGYWNMQKANIAPRLSVAWAPNAKTSVRFGGGMYYDHFGEGIVNSFDQEGSFGLSGNITTPAGLYSESDTPRFTGPHDIPSIAGCGASPSTVTYPFTPTTVYGCDFAITWGIDNQLKTPYSYDLDASIQLELPGGFMFEEAYVGRFGRHLLQQLDLAEPVNLVDPSGGGDYFTAGKALSKITDQKGGNYGNAYTGTAPVSVPTIQYFEDMFPFMQGYDFIGESATEAIYNNEWAPNRYGLGETTALADIDFYCYYGCPSYINNGNPRFYQSQFSSLYAWSSIGTSSYNALQATLRHPASHGLTFDLSYTLSKSIDMGSGAETSNWENANDAFGGSAIQNSWDPKLNKAPSDFDTRNLLTLDWVYDVPFGRGRTFLSNSSRLVDALIGGIEWSGLSRVASALPFSTFEPGYTTNWQLGGYGVKTGSVQIQKHVLDGTPQVFAGNSANTINNGIYTGNPIRLPYPGEAGERNNFRGDGYFDIDSSLAKTWGIGDNMKLKLDAEVYNVGNNVRFDDSPLWLNTLLSSGTLGYYSHTLTTYRRMQFGARIDF